MTSGGHNRRVLFVDDEPNVLEGIVRNLGRRFEIVTATSGAAGLEVLARKEEPFAVIVSDMRMPGMDGALFLARVRESCPTSTRFLLTGYADVTSAVSAVNEGQIFRFLCKPCPSDALASALEAGVAQYALLTAERDIMERTLAAVVKTLGDVLSLAQPELFNRATLVKSYVSQVLRKLSLEGAWQIEIAASLHTLGLIALPSELVHRAPNRAPLTIEESRQLGTHPETARRILEAIPRLEEVALIVAQQAVEPDQGPEWVRRGARLLRLATRIEARVSHGATLKDALASLGTSASEEERSYLAALQALCSDSDHMTSAQLRLRDLRAGMILQCDVKTRDGALVLPMGRELSAVLIERLRQFAASRGLDEPISVRVPPSVTWAR